MQWSDIVTKFLAYLLTEKRVSENTFIAYRQDLKQFQYFCTKYALEIENIKRSNLQDFLAFLKEKGLSAKSIARKIASLKGIFSYMQAQYGVEDYAQEISIPKMKKSLPNCLSLEELEQLFQAAESDRSLMGKRNKIMLYLMYVTGMRVSELILLKLVHIHRDTAMIAIEGKRGRQRMIPLPDRMMQELGTYIDQTRSALLSQYQGTSDYLFPVIYGKKIKALTRQAFWFIVKQLWRKAGIQRPVSPHVLRHSFATHMLNKGINLRSLQMLLGHEQLATVQIYTHVDTNHLRKIYDKKHPRS
jgi:integrase/recombinase XerD